jgi:hydroxymethylglutaryl-CoA lyase
MARGLIAAGFRSIEVASTASPRVAPAMADDQVGPFLADLGRPEGVELVTLVPPSPSCYRRFIDLGLGPQELGHTMGVFLSAMDEHNVANLRSTVAESLSAIRSIVPRAIRSGTRVIGTASAAFGFLPHGSARPVKVTPRRVRELALALVELGASSVTLSDLQGLASPEETEDMLGEVVSGSEPSPVPIGYHPHHRSVDAALANVEAAARAGVALFDGSLGAVGGCVTGAPGNAPTEGIVERLEHIGISTGLEWTKLASLAAVFGREVYGPLSVREE